MPYRKSFFILFTPRSGSTWLRSLCENTGRLGSPAEHFAPTRVDRMRSYQRIEDLPAHISMLFDRQRQNPVFSFKITMGQMADTFGDETTFARAFGPIPCVFLIRRDMVLRAVSSYRKRVSSTGHSFAKNDGGEAAKAKAVDYRPVQIRNFLLRGVETERRAYNFLQKLNAPAVRLSYEGVSQNPEDALNRILGLLHEPPLSAFEDPGKVEVMRNELSYEYAEQFRREHPNLVRKLTAERRDILDSLEI
ncbi:MAG: Stf0 family sulfotransferase [Pseudomonadota bacterium]